MKEGYFKFLDGWVEDRHTFHPPNAVGDMPMGMYPLQSVASNVNSQMSWLNHWTRSDKIPADRHVLDNFLRQHSQIHDTGNVKADSW
jgi:hypothetical protein